MKFLVLCAMVSVLVLNSIAGDTKSDYGYSHSISHDDGHTRHVTHYYTVKCHEEKKKDSPLILESKKHTIILGHGDNKNVIIDKKGEKIIFR